MWDVTCNAALAQSDEQGVEDLMGLNGYNALLAVVKNSAQLALLASLTRRMTDLAALGLRLIRPTPLTRPTQPGRAR